MYKSLIQEGNIIGKDIGYDEFIQWFSINNYTSKYAEAIHSHDYLTQLYHELICEGGKILDIEGHLVLYYLDDTLDVRKVYIIPEIVGPEEKIDIYYKIASKLIELAEEKPLLIHEVNERQLSSIFSYTRSNTYDTRPYMMVLNSDRIKKPLYFDEVV